jgi:hypothetical protein
MRNGRYNSLIIVGLLFIILFQSCYWSEENEAEINNIYINIPQKYDFVISRIRKYKDSDLINVSSVSGLKDYLSVGLSNIQNGYSFLTRNRISEKLYQDIYFRKYHQFLTPNFYKFYDIEYQISQNVNSSGDLYDSLDYYVSATLGSNLLLKINLKDSSVVTTHIITDLGKTRFDSVDFSHLYKIELLYKYPDNMTFKTVYFDIEKGIIRFETFTNEVFLL